MNIYGEWLPWDQDQITYLRNKNFSSTIVLELTRTDTEEKECIGVVFDVETSTNDISRLFFWHKGGIPENHYRREERTMAISEVRQYLQKNQNKMNIILVPAMNDSVVSYMIFIWAAWIWKNFRDFSNVPSRLK